MKHSTAAWRWGSPEHRAEVVAGALRCFFSQSLYEPVLGELHLQMAAVDFDLVVDDCIVLGRLADFISFEINAASLYVGGAECMDWAIGRSLSEGRTPCLEVYLTAVDSKRVFLTACQMRRKT